MGRELGSYWDPYPTVNLVARETSLSLTKVLGGLWSVWFPAESHSAPWQRTRGQEG